MMATRIRFALGFLIALVALYAAACSSETQPGAIHVLTADTEVGPVMAQYIDRGITRAEENNAKLVIIQLDTPGGLDTSMRSIIQRFERSTVPIVVYVAPAGSRAASAGTFITMAANIAAMAPNTSIGAAAAINSDGSDIGGTLGTKIENDAVSYIRGIAQLRGRNADWAEQAVRQAVSVNQTEAVALGVVDFEADSLDAVIAKVDGMQTHTGANQPVTLTGLSAAPIVHTDMTPWEHLLNFIADPTVASILITLGLLGLVFELANPGLVLPGVAGAIAIILGFIGFETLPIHTAGLVLIGLALLFFAMEIVVPSGFLAAGGVVALVLGSFIAFRGTPSSAQPPVPLVIVLLFLFAAMFGAFVVTVLRVRRQLAVPFGTSGLIGHVAVVRTPLAPEGMVFLQGERWKARLDHGSADAGERVRITGVKGFRLDVQKEDQP